MVLDARSLENCEVNMLILSDGRMGHLNQSLAIAHYLNASYCIVPVRFTCKLFKPLSYVLDFLKIYTPLLFKLENPLPQSFEMIVGAGSNTYYAAKTLAQHYHVKSVTMMLPKGYRFDFDYIFAQSHDHPPKQENIIEIPANVSFTKPQGLFVPRSKSIGIIIGGNNAHFTMDKERLKKQLETIFEQFQGYEIAITTSPRTSKEIETLLENYSFSYSVIFSRNKINPIADFLHHCEVVFITMDSTSMMSEAISYGNSYVEILPLNGDTLTKFYKMAHSLEEKKYAHIFNGSVAYYGNKIDFKELIQKAIT